MLFAAVLLGALTAWAAPAGAATVTFTNSSGITINDGAVASPSPSQITVSGLTGTVTDVDVVLTGYSHTAPADVDVLLAGPGGQSVVLMSDLPERCSIDVTDLDLTFSDGGAGFPPAPTNLTSGTYAPTDDDGACDANATADTLMPTPSGSTLAQFNNVNPNGTWSLYVADDFVGDVGSIDGWSLKISGVTTSQNIVFGPLYDRPVNKGPFTVSATAPGGTVTFTTTTPDVCTSSGTNGATIDTIAVGTCTVKASQAGDATYAPATKSRSFQVTKVKQTIAFGILGDRKLSKSPFTVAATASSGLTVTFSTTTPSVCTSSGSNGSTITLLTTGTCTVQADQAGDATYGAAAPRSRSFTVTP